MCERKQPVEVNACLDARTHCINPRLPAPRFAGWHQAKVALRQRDRFLANERAQHRQARRILNRPRHQLRVAHATGAVQNDARHAHLRVKVAQPRDECGGGAGHRLHIKHNHDWRGGQASDVGAAARVIVARVAVEKAHHALDQRKVGPGAAARKHAGDLRGRHEPSIKIVARSPRRQRVIARVNVVRAALEGRNPQPACRQRGDQPSGDSRFAAAAHRRGQQQAREGGGDCAHLSSASWKGVAGCATRRYQASTAAGNGSAFVPFVGFVVHIADVSWKCFGLRALRGLRGTHR